MEQQTQQTQIFLSVDDILRLEKKKKPAHSLKADGCIDFDGAKDSRGYGKFSVGKKIISAHKASYLAHFRKTNCDTLIHTCGNKWCINPLHLKEGKRPGRPSNDSNGINDTDYIEKQP